VMGDVGECGCDGSCLADCRDVGADTGPPAGRVSAEPRSSQVDEWCVESAEATGEVCVREKCGEAACGRIELACGGHSGGGRPDKVCCDGPPEMLRERGGAGGGGGGGGCIPRGDGSASER